MWVLVEEGRGMGETAGGQWRTGQCSGQLAVSSPKGCVICSSPLLTRRADEWSAAARTESRAAESTAASTRGTS